MPGKLDSVLASYLTALRDAGVGQAQLDLLAREFLPGLSNLTRHGVVRRSEMQDDDLGLELLHDVCEVALAGRLGSERGDLLRLLGRLAYRHVTRHRARFASLIENAVGELPARAVAVTRAGLAEHEDLIAELECVDVHKRCGNLHLGRIGSRMALTPHELRARLESLARALGHKTSDDRFWIARLAECLVSLLRAQTESTLPDVVPSDASRLTIRKRLRRLLARIGRYRGDAPIRRGLRLVRGMTRERRYPRRTVVRAALELGADPHAVRLLEAEWLRGHAHNERALALLTPNVPDEPTGARERKLVALARARGFELAGDYRRASDALEAVAGLGRRDPLIAYNRLVLAEAANDIARARSAAANLAAITRELDRTSPLLTARIDRKLRQAVRDTPPSARRLTSPGGSMTLSS